MLLENLVHLFQLLTGRQKMRMIIERFLKGVTRFKETAHPVLQISMREMDGPFGQVPIEMMDGPLKKLPGSYIVLQDIHKKPAGIKAIEGVMRIIG